MSKTKAIVVKSITGYVVEQWMDQASVDRTNALMQECIEKANDPAIAVNPLKEFVPAWEEYIREHQAPHWQHVQSFESMQTAMDFENKSLKTEGLLTRLIHAEIMVGNAMNYTFINEVRRVKAAKGIEG